jgi:hypothetical protein
MEQGARKMNRLAMLSLVIASLLLAGVRCYARTAVGPNALMESPSEQETLLSPVNLRSQLGRATVSMFPELGLQRAEALAPANASPLDQIEEAIRQANRGEPSLRFPVLEGALQNLRDALAEQGTELSPPAVGALVDYAHGLLRENSKVALLDKAMRDLKSERMGFHGNVAELAEARARNMMLTKDAQSEHYDIIEREAPFRGAQLKVYKNSTRGLRETIADLENLPEGAARYGIMPGESLLQLESRGLVFRKTINGKDFFVPDEDHSITLMPSKAFASTDEAIDRTMWGKRLLGGMTEPLVAGEGLLAGTVEDGLESGAAGTSWLPQVIRIGGQAIAIAGAAGLVVYWGYTVYEWNTGEISTRQFLTSSASLGGGLAGGSAGALAGVWAGGEIGSIFGPVGTTAGLAIGGIIGGVSGGIVGGGAAKLGLSSYYQFEDNKFGRRQQKELVQFLARYYSTPSAAAGAAK